MRKKVVFCFSIAGVALLATALAAQDVRQGPLAGLPGERGVYYRGASGWIALPSSLLVGFKDGGAKEFFGVGGRDAIVQLSGAHAALRVTTAKPTFIVQGFSAGSRLFLVRSEEKLDFREIRMPLDHAFPNTPHFRNQDLIEVEMEGVSGDVVRVRPHTDLKPGEYVIVSVLDPSFRFIRVGFGFGVGAAVTTGP
jgi:hypothetical protein